MTTAVAASPSIATMTYAIAASGRSVSLPRGRAAVTSGAVQAAPRSTHARQPQAASDAIFQSAPHGFPTTRAARSSAGTLCRARKERQGEPRRRTPRPPPAARPGRDMPSARWMRGWEARMASSARQSARLCDNGARADVSSLEQSAKDAHGDTLRRVTGGLHGAGRIVRPSLGGAVEHETLGIAEAARRARELRCTGASRCRPQGRTPPIPYERSTRAPASRCGPRRAEEHSVPHEAIGWAVIPYFGTRASVCEVMK